MTDKPSEKKDTGAGAGADPKRPHATLDLKATEVKAAADARAASESKLSDSKVGEAKVTADTAAQAGKSTAGSSKPAPAPVPRSPSAFTRIVTHLVAGIAGGGVVLFGGDRLAQTLGVPSPTARIETTTADLERRLGALETEPSPTIETALKANEDRLSKLEALATDVAALNERQEKIAASTSALLERVPDDGEAARMESRLAGLEDQLKTIASAAQSETGGNRIADIAAVTGKIAAIDARLSEETAQLKESAARDLDQRLATRDDATKTDLARLTQQVEKLKADGERFEKSILAAQEQTGQVASALGAMRATIEQQGKTFAKAADVAAAVTPVAGLISKIEGSLDGVLKKEKERQTHTERIVMALELGNLKRALDSGKPFASELEAVTAASGGRLDLAALEPFKATGVPSLAELKDEARPALLGALDAGAVAPDASVWDRMLTSVKSVVRIRKIDVAEGDATLEARIARIEKALAENRLGDALAEAGKLPEAAQSRIADWRAKAAARHSVDDAIANVENELKAALASPSAPAPAGEDK